MQNTPYRTAAAHRSPPTVCSSSDSQSTHPESVWPAGLSRATGDGTLGIAPCRFPCCSPLMRCGRTAEVNAGEPEGGADGDGSREDDQAQQTGE